MTVTFYKIFEIMLLAWEVNTECSTKYSYRNLLQVPEDGSSRYPEML